MLLVKQSLLPHPQPRKPFAPRPADAAAVVAEVCVVAPGAESAIRHVNLEVGGLDHYIDSRLGHERFHIG